MTLGSITVRQRIRTTGLFALALMVAACRGDPSDLTIKNGTKHRVSDVSITDGRTTWNLGSLNPGANVTFEQPLHGEADAVISWSLQGERHSAEGCYYTGGMPLRGSVVIVGDHLDYRCK
jgi:hypothetical protein